MTIRQLTGPDAAFLYGERPEWHFHVAALMVLDPGSDHSFSADRLIEGLGQRLHLVPQFRWKLLEGPLHLRLDRPIWVDDPSFDLRSHVHRIALPSPGDERALGDLVGRLTAIKLDRSRPLWEMWVIEGLSGGRVALLAKLHHSIIDGQSGAELATVLFDLEADPPPPPEPPPWEPEAAPSLLQRLAVATANTADGPRRLARFTGQLAGQAVTVTKSLVGPSPAAQPLQAPRTPFNGRLTSDRVFACAAVSLGDARLVKQAFDVKLNDVVLAISSGALRSYLASLDAIPDKPLIAQVPVSIRDHTNESHVGTKVAALFCSLASDIVDPGERLRAIHQSSVSGKEMRRGLDRHRRVDLTEMLPPAAIAVAARTWSLAGLDGRTPPMFNLIISNVAGPPFDLFVAGARISAMYPMGPLLYGSGVNFTVVSSAEHLNFGLMACPALVPDPWEIAERLPQALTELLDYC